MTDQINEMASQEYRKFFPVSTEIESIEQGRSLVVTIGINDYKHWFKLNNAVNDAIGFQQTLVDKLGFIAPFEPLVDSAATKVAIEELVREKLREVVEENDSLIVFYAGHGQTRIDSLSEAGYIIPVEARTPDTREYWSDYIRLNHWLQDVSELPIRHILVILDACHSGLALGSAIDIYRDGVIRYRNDIGRNRSRKVITSAKRDQPALDGGSILPGNSLFTGMLIKGVNLGEADMDRNGYITSSELGLYLQQKVGQSSESKQTPVFGSFNLDAGGEMVIVLKKEKDLIDYTSLESHLNNHRWKEADLMTFEIMLKLSNCEDKEYLDVEDIQRLAFSDLQSIDELWTLYSNNHFGFSVQNKIWQNEPINGNPRSGLKEFRIFGNSVGWNEKRKAVDFDYARWNENLEAVDRDPDGSPQEYIWHRHKNLNFSLQAPIGHLPWGGYGELGMSKRWRLGYLLLRFSQGEKSDIKRPSKISSGGAISGKLIIEPKKYEESLPFNSEIPTSDKKDWLDHSQEVTQEDIGGIKLDLAIIPAGSFLMGSEDGYDDEKPCHKVKVSQFLIGKHVVTQEQWRAVAKLPKVDIDLDPDPSRFKGRMRPVIHVSWYAAKEFCDRLSRETGKEYRLPSEAEWEYACRAGTTTPFHFGETLTSDLANYGCQKIGNKKEQDLRHTAEVGNFKVANAFGLYDMHGNVWEWCLDYWHDDYTGAPFDGSAWTNTNNGDEKFRVLRGGGWGNDPKDCRSANRHRMEPELWSYEVGFRVVCKQTIASNIEEGRQKTEKSARFALE